MHLHRDCQTSDKPEQKNLNNNKSSYDWTHVPSDWANYFRINNTSNAHLDGVESGEPLGQVRQVLEALEGGGGATGLQDEPTLRHEHGALAQDVGIQLQTVTTLSHQQ